MPDATQEPLGTLARRIFAAQQRSPYRQTPTDLAKAMRIRFRLLLDLGRIESFARRNAAIVRRERGISIPRQLVQLLRLALVERVDPATYYAHHLYDAPLGLGEIAYYLSRTEMKNGLYSLLRLLRRDDPNFDLALTDKLQFTETARRAGLPIAPIFGVAAEGRWLTAPLPLEGDLFVKPVHGRGAAGARAFHAVGDGSYQARDGGVCSARDLLERIAEDSQRQAVLLTRRLRNHAEIADLAVESLITFRVFTCMDASGTPVVTHAMLRTLCKLEPDWHTDEEFAAAIDLETGRLQQMCGDANLAPDAWWDRHPKTGAQVTGRIIAHWPELAALAVRAHRAFSGRMIIGWDLALAPEGAMLLEGNSKPDTHFLQRVHRRMIGRSPMAPLIRHHLNAAESLLRKPPI
jgi:hypothetical protein